MSSNINKLYKAWDHVNLLISNKEHDQRQINFDELIAGFFLPGPFCYYIFDFFYKKFLYFHPNVKQIFGLDPDNIDLEQFISLIHPEDMPHMAKCEEAAFNFVFKNLPVEKRLSYKVSSCYRLKDAQGNYRLFLQQGITLSMDAAGAMEKSLGVFTDISHLTKKNPYKISFLGINGEPSYYNVDPDKFVDDYVPSKTLFTERESEIIALLSQGLTAKEIASQLHISNETVRTHTRNVLSKSGCKSTPQLIVKCIKEGLI
jgi:DNA-binding CsgD family transcriptional regulator